jgi:cellulose synthase operon protein C
MPNSRLLSVALLLSVTLLAGGCGGPAPAELLAEARTATARKDYRTAAIQLRNLLKEEPANVEAVRLLAEVAAASGGLDTAERNYRRAVELGADPAGFWRGWVDVLLLQGRYADALERLASVRAESPADRAAVLARKARAERGLGRLADAEATLAEAIRAAPADAAAQVELAGLLLATGREPAAVAAIDRALALDGDNPDALLLRAGELLGGARAAEAAPLLERALAAGAARGNVPAQATALAYLAELDLAAGRVPAAGERAAALGRLVGQSPELRYLTARIAVEQGELARAKTQLQEALAVDRDYLPARRLIGALYVLENQFELAEMNLRPVVAADPGDLFVRRLLATVLVARNRPAEALPLLDSLAVSDDGARQSLLAMMGQASLQLGDVGKAVAYFRQGNEQFPGNPLFELGLGLTLLAEGRVDEAEQLIRRARGEQADAARAAFEAILLMRKGQPAAARTAAAASVERFPDAAWSHNLLGSVLLAVGDFPAARASLVTAVRLDPDDSTALSNLARVEQLLNNRDAARDAWRRILATAPDNLDAAAALAQLETGAGDVAAALRVLEPFRRRSARAGLMTAALLLDSGDTVAARTAVDQLLAANRDNPEALNLAGLVALADGGAAEAEARFRRASELRPDQAIYGVNLARALLASGQVDAASRLLAGLRSRVGSSPQFASIEVAIALSNRQPAAARAVVARLASSKTGDERFRAALEAEVLLAEGRPAEARQRYADAYGLGPGLDAALGAWRADQQAKRKPDPVLLDDWLKRNPTDQRARRLIAELLLAAGLTDASRGHYERVLAADPRDLGALNNLAWLYQEAGDPRAVALAGRALALAPESPAVQDTAGWVEFRLGKRESGLALLGKAADGAPANLDIQFHFALALIETGERERGRELLATIVESGRPFASRAAAVDRLRQL